MALEQDWCDTHGVPRFHCKDRHASDDLRAAAARSEGLERLLQAAVADADRHSQHARDLRIRCEHLTRVVDAVRRVAPRLVAMAEDDIA